MHPFTRVVLYARQYRSNPYVSETLHHLKDYLLSLKTEVGCDLETSTYFTDLKIPILTMKDFKTESDLIIVVGGDGSLLGAAQMAVQANLPIVGINRGRLGFLTDIAPDDIEKKLPDILQGHYIEEHRSLIHAMITGEQGSLTEEEALNDIVLTQGAVSHMIEFDVYIDALFVSHYRADGLIIATPTGSTAYALSAGGPILHPDLQAVVLVPMFPHTLSSRPIVLDLQSTIEIKFPLYNLSPLQLSFDGRARKDLPPGHSIQITKKDKPLRLLHPLGYNYYKTLRSKLGWERKAV